MAKTVSASAWRLEGYFWEARRQLEVRKGDVISALHMQALLDSGSAWCHVLKAECGLSGKN